MRTIIVAAVTALVVPVAPGTAPQPAGPGPAADPGAGFAEVRLPTGIRMHYAVQGDPAGPVVILLHGYSDSSFSWSLVMPRLPAGWRVYALDQRGHGETDRPAGGYTAAAMAGDVLAFMDVHGIERATIVGHSGGTLITQQLMAGAPERVDRAVIVAGATTGRNIVGIEQLRAAVMALSDPVDPGFAREFQVGMLVRPVPEPFVERVIEESLKLPARVWQDYLDGVLDADPAFALRATRIPTLIIWGDQDVVMPRSEQDALLDLIPGSSLVVYPGVGHSPNWEDPERFAADLIAFVESAR